MSSKSGAHAKFESLSAVMENRLLGALSATASLSSLVSPAFNAAVCPWLSDPLSAVAGCRWQRQRLAFGVSWCCRCITCTERTWDLRFVSYVPL